MQNASQWSVEVSEAIRHVKHTWTSLRLLMPERGVPIRPDRATRDTHHSNDWSLRQWRLSCFIGRGQEEPHHRQHEPSRVVPIACTDCAFLGDGDGDGEMFVFLSVLVRFRLNRSSR